MNTRRRLEILKRRPFPRPKMGGRRVIVKRNSLDIDAAKFAILGAKLTLGTIVYNGPVTDSSTLKVIAQSPNMVDSAKVNIGTRINITVTQSQK